MPKRPPLCTPATVGMLSEEGFSIEEIAKKMKESRSLVKRYLEEWRAATPYDRNLARSGVRPHLGK